MPERYCYCYMLNCRSDTAAATTTARGNVVTAIATSGLLYLVFLNMVKMDLHGATRDNNKSCHMHYLLWHV